MLHRNYLPIAERLWPRAEWVHGEGRYATTCCCPPGLTVELHRTREAAEKAFAFLDDIHGAQAGHRLVDLEGEETATLEAFMTVADFADDEPPEREWLVDNLIPASGLTMLSGDGAVGKTLLLLELGAAVAHPTWHWLGRPTKHGRALGVFCEDDWDELHRRLVAIAAHMRCELEELSGFGVQSRVGEDNLLMTFDRERRGSATAFFDELHAAALAFRADLIVIDSLHDVFAGNELDRGVARQFTATLNGLGNELNAAVVLSAHPSRAGMAAGDGLSGSTGWNNGPRQRLLLRRPDDPTADERDRVLLAVKTNYSGMGNGIALEWRDGVIAPKGGAADPFGEADRVFLDCLDAATGEGRLVTDSPRAGNFAPRVFAGMAQGRGVGERRLGQAMERLFAAGKIRMADERKKNRHWHRRLMRREDEP
jgi:RecA-family ATPase